MNSKGNVRPRILNKQGSPWLTVHLTGSGRQQVLQGPKALLRHALPGLLLSFVDHVQYKCTRMAWPIPTPSAARRIGIGRVGDDLGGDSRSSACAAPTSKAGDLPDAAESRGTGTGAGAGTSLHDASGHALPTTLDVYVHNLLSMKRFHEALEGDTIRP